MEIKSKLQNLLTVIVESITNGAECKIVIKKLPDDTTLVIDIYVPHDKVGLVLGRSDQNGNNPMKLSILRICKQTGFYYGFKECLLKIGELPGGEQRS